MGAATTTPEVADTAMAAVTDAAQVAGTTVEAGTMAAGRTAAADPTMEVGLTVAETAIGNSSRSI
jgi:hypothetical protein